MPNYALIKNGIVENIIVASTAAAVGITGYDSVIVVTDPAAVIGSAYDSVNHAFLPQALQPRKKQLTKLEFRSLFTFAELVAVETAAETSPAVRVLNQNQALADYIDLSDPRTIEGMQFLVSQGLITQDRCNAILAA